MASQSENLVKSCHSCGVDQTSEAICPDCGPSSVHYGFVSDGTDNATLICTGCHQPVSKRDKSLQPAPKICMDCGSNDLGWRNPLNNSWMPEPLLAGDGEGPWVCGDFDGDYQGKHVEGEFRKLGSERGGSDKYEVKFTRAQLENLVLVAEPPERRAEDEKNPLKLGDINDVFVYRDADPVAKLYKVDLDDFRLHEWQQTTVDDKDPVKIIGRLQGKAYGRLRIPPKREINKPKLATLLPKSATAVPVAPEPVRSSPIAAQEDLNQYCNTCNLFFLAAAFLCLWLGCRLSTALLGLAVLGLQCWWRSHRLAKGKNSFSNTTEIVISIVLVILAVLIYLIVRSERCVHASLWWLAGMALLLLLTALLRRCWAWLIISVLWILLLLSFYCHQLVGECQAPAAEQQSGLELSLPTFNPLPAIHAAGENLRDGLQQLLAFDHDSQVVTSQSLNTNGERVSIDQALQNPEEFFSCDPKRAGTGQNPPPNEEARSYNIYFGEAALFEKDKAVLTSSAEAYLQKIKNLVARNPDVRIILTGHTDRMGQQDHNLYLSQQRAKAVAEWLVANNVLPPERIEIRGAGDRYPVVNDPRLYRLNRRVELSINCPRNGS